MNRTSRSWFVPLLLSGALAAQGKTWIVDAQSRPGAQFTTLSAAAQAAGPGDLLEVRDGSYQAFTLSKGLTIACQPGVTIQGSVYILMTIQDLPAGQQATISGATFLGGVGVQRCKGRVLLDRCRGGNGPVLVSISDSTQVHLTACKLLGLAVTDSVVVCADCEVAPGTELLVTPAVLRAWRSELVLSRSSVRGSIPAATAMKLEQCQVTVLGDPTTAVIARQSGDPAPAIDAVGGSIVLDPNVRVTGYLSAPIVGTATVTTRSVPSLSVAGAAPGGVLKTDLFSPAGDLVAVLVSLSANRLPVLPGYDLWLDPNAMLVLGSGVQDASQHFKISFTMPNDAAFRLVTCTQQAASGTLAGGVQWSNPAAYAHH